MLFVTPTKSVAHYYQCRSIDVVGATNARQHNASTKYK
jgi:hypothetical protein